MRSDKQELILLIGFIGAGKTTYAMKLLKENPTETIRISMDDIIQMLSFYAYQPNLIQFYLSEELNLLKRALVYGLNVIIDRTNLDRATRSRFIETGKRFRVLANEILSKFEEPEIFGADSIEKLKRAIKSIPEPSDRESFENAFTQLIPPFLETKSVPFSFHQALRRLAELKIVGIYFRVSPEICLERRLKDPARSLREKLRPIDWQSVLKKMQLKFEYPQLEEGFDRIEIRGPDFELIRQITP